MVVKRLFAPALLTALDIGSANAVEYFAEYFYGNQSSGTVTLKLSGYCQGSATLPVTDSEAHIGTHARGSDNYFRI